MANVMKKGIPLGEVEKVLNELPKYGIYILAGEHDAKLFSDAGKVKIESMQCKLCFFEKENGKLAGKLADLQSEYIELENFKNNEVNALKVQLIKAKEIIQAMLKDIPNRMWYTDATIKEAEQFLKE